MTGHAGRDARGRHGLVILAVLVVVTMAALVGSAVLLRTDAGTLAARGELRRAQARVAAWSGVRAVMTRLGEQRDDLLAGAAPVLPEGWTLPVESADGALVFRVVPGASGLPATSENARLDVNVADAAMLAKLPGVGGALAERIVAARPAGGFESVESLARVEGIDRSTVSAEGDDAIEANAAPTTAVADVGAPTIPLADLLTVWSFDPNVQGGAAGETIGLRRVRFPGGWWTDSLAMEIGERFGSPSLFGRNGIGVGGDPPATLGAFVAALRGAEIPVEAWGKQLETLTPYDATHRRGLVDMNRAPAEVLGALPGIDEPTARAIVDARERTPLESRGSIAWAVEVGAMSPEALVQAADWLTTRSTQWRVRVEGGFEAPTPDGAGGDTPKALLDRVVYEAVIDVSTTRPRLATLREVTGLSETLAFSRATRSADETDARELRDEPDALLESADEPEFTRLRRGPDRRPMPGGDAAAGPPPAPSNEVTSPAAPDPGAGATGRTGRWTRGGGP